MSFFNKKKVEEKPEIVEEAPEEVKAQIANASRDLKNLAFKRKKMDFIYGQIEHHSNQYRGEEDLQNVTALYFDTKTKTMYKLNMRATIPQNENISVDLKNLEILRLNENKEIVGYENVRKVYQYHPYQSDWEGEVRQSWTKEKGYKAKSVEFIGVGEEISYIDDGINGIITNILRDAVEREIENRRLLKAEKNPNR